ncbi:MAG: hypothetical protein J6D34_04395 [Atopobiaceae bacterium]|nr:hypothetical protein [Atopobiaceae bacterium]
MAYKTESGAKVSGDLTRQSAYEGFDNLVVSLSQDRAAIVVKCADGIVRAYHTADCSPAWEMPSSMRQVQFVSYVSPVRVLLQDTSGKCTLVKAETGAVSQTSDTVLPSISHCSFDESSELVVATFENDDSGTPQGLVVVSVDEGGFGSESLIRHGLAVSKDRTKALCYLPWLDDYVVYPRYSLAELIARGREELALYRQSTANEETP